MVMAIEAAITAVRSIHPRQMTDAREDHPGSHNDKPSVGIGPEEARIFDDTSLHG